MKVPEIDASKERLAEMPLKAPYSSIVAVLVVSSVTAHDSSPVFSTRQAS
jgi:hypothetical protein